MMRGRTVAVFIDAPKVLQAAGQPPKRIEEYAGKLRTGSDAASVARMVSPAGWAEPGQTPDFDEITVVLAGELRAELKDADHVVRSGQALLVRRGEWVRYSTPGAEGAEYVSVCLPAFSPQRVHRDEA
jgi:mannose-6-phosphate isomerase-like protein (cupin superfamily)